jgi:hypothetical protein
MLVFPAFWPVAKAVGFRSAFLFLIELYGRRGSRSDVPDGNQ